MSATLTHAPHLDDNPGALMHMHRAANRHAGDFDKRARAIRIVAAALHLGLISLDDIVAAREDHRERARR